jgi:predicted HTH domain antitoxin
MSQLILDVPDEALLSLRLSDAAAGMEIRLAAAMKFYELGRLSSGGAARLAGIPRTVFLSRLADYGIDTFVLSEHYCPNVSGACSVTL